MENLKSYYRLKYLGATQGIGLILRADQPNRDVILKCYVDASYLTHPDSKPHQGYCLTLVLFKQSLLSGNSSLLALRRAKFVLYNLLWSIIFSLSKCVIQTAVSFGTTHSVNPNREDIKGLLLSQIPGSNSEC